MKLPAPAKVNLHLEVLRRREDGFHDIETLMVPISLADQVTVSVEKGDEIVVTCDQPGVPLGPDNLAAMAARAFAARTGQTFGAHIHLEKHVPMGAGLGGGSSDAATVIVALDRLLGTQLPVGELESIAAEVGSDVAFFIRRQPALCRGRGEKIEPVPLGEKLDFVLAKPGFGVNTGWAYQSWSTCQGVAEDREQKLGEIRIFNSLERPVFEKYLLLPVMKEWLLLQPEVRVAAMSGSGSTMFAILRPGSKGEALQERIKTTFGPSIWTAACHSLEA